MSAIIPGMSHGYRTTTGMYKWIILVAVVGAIGLVWVFRLALRDADEIGRKAGYPKNSQYLPDDPPPR